MRYLGILTVCLMLTGCGLIPKKVEFGQDKVKAVPVESVRQEEFERKAVALAGAKARVAEQIATVDGSQAATPAAEAAELSEAVSRSLGPPAKPWEGEVLELVTRLDREVAKLNKRLDNYREDVAPNVGKKIEGTGWFQISYIKWLGILFGCAVVAIVLGKTGLRLVSLMYPQVGIGLNAVSATADLVRKGFSSVVQAGEEFKSGLDKVVEDPQVAQAVKDLFRSVQMGNQDRDVQDLIRTITK